MVGLSCGQQGIPISGRGNPIWEGLMAEEIEAVKESAKAIQEVAKTSGKAIDAGVKAGGWIDKIFGDAFGHTVAHYWTDRMAARRIEASIYNWERAEMLFHKAAERLRKHGVT